MHKPKQNTQPQHDAKKAINTEQVVRYLSRMFRTVTEDMGNDATRGTELHKLQTEFCYYIDEIERGPIFHVPKVIADCNEFLNNILSSKR